MSRDFTPSVITANALLSGDAIWLTADDRWSGDISEAELIEDEAHGQIRLIDAMARSGEAVGVYMAEAKPGTHGPEPVHFREAFRTRGPGNYAHGKQEGF